MEGSSVLLGGDNGDLTYQWLLADSADGTYETAGTDKLFEIPEDAAGKYLKLCAADKEGNEETSIAYKVLKEEKAAGAEGNEEILRAASKGYIDEDEVLDLDREITNRDCAKMLAKLWGLEAPKEKISISDVPESDPDYNMIAAVVEAEMMNLKDPNVTAAQGTLYNAGVTKDEAAKRTAFCRMQRLTEMRWDILPFFPAAFRIMRHWEQSPNLMTRSRSSLHIPAT